MIRCRSDDATVEHLVAQSNGGLSADDNCVACCRAINNLLGNKSYKEKLRIVLQHRPQFTCPRPKAESEETLPTLDADGVARKRFELVFSKLEKQVRNRPLKVESLRNAIANVFDGQVEDDDVERIIAELQSTGYITIENKSVIYQQNGDGRRNA